MFVFIVFDKTVRSNFNTREFNSREIVHVWKQLFDMFGVSCGAFWIKIGGNQADTFPNLPIYPRTLDFTKNHTTTRQRKLKNT